MFRIRSILAKLGFWTVGRGDGQAFDDEIRTHLELLTERYVREGMDPKVARWAARRQFGNTALLRETRRRLQTFEWLSTVWRDLRYAARQLRRNPAFTATATVSLALAIGINAAIFSIVNAALLKRLPVPNPGELVMLTDPNASMILGGLQTGARSLLSHTEFIELRDRTTTISGLCASGVLLERWPIHISNGSQEEARGRLVSENYFSIFGIAPTLGRFFSQRDAAGPGKDPYVVISYDYWRRRFGGNKAVLGTPVRFYRTAFVIIGVAAKGFRGETVGQDPDLWLPAMMQPAVIPGMDGLHEDLTRSQDKLMWLHVFGRRKPGVTIAQVQSEVNVLFHGILEAGYPTTMPAEKRKEALNQRVVVRPIGTGAFHGRAEFSAQWTILSALAALVLFIACANVANLLLARSAARSREVAIRLSIGAAKTRLVRQFLTESLLLAAFSGIAGVLVAAIASRAIPLFISDAGGSFALSTGIDLQVLGFTACITVATGVLFGLAPAIRSTTSGLNETLKDSSRATTASPRTTFAKTLVMVQVALSLLLVLGAGLFLRTLWNLESLDLGYPRDHLLLVGVNGSNAGYLDGHRPGFSRDLADRIRQIPGVRAVTWSDRGLFSGFDGAFAVTVEGFTPRNADDMGSTGNFNIGPGYFSTIGIPMLLGREIGPRDIANSLRVCVINKAFARRFFSGRNPIGRHIETYSRRSMEVIGVAEDARVNSLRGDIDPKFYAAANELDPGSSVTFEVRTLGDPSRLSNAIRKAILSTNGDLQITSERTLREIIEEQNTQPRLIARLCSLFGILALLLAATGVYGVLSYRIARRTNEIGLRMALGAGKSTVIAMIIRETGLLIAYGVAAGVIAAAICARLLAVQLYGLGAQGPRWSLAQYEHVDSATQLYGVRVMDPLTVGAVVAILAAVGLIAAIIPALRAARVDPMHALRHD